MDSENIRKWTQRINLVFPILAANDVSPEVRAIAALVVKEYTTKILHETEGIKAIITIK